MNEDTLCVIIHALLDGLGPGERVVDMRMSSQIDPLTSGCLHWLYDLGTDELGCRWVVPGWDDSSLRPYALRFESDSGCNFVTVVEWPESKVTELLGRLLMLWEHPDMHDELV